VKYLLLALALLSTAAFAAPHPTEIRSVWFAPSVVLVQTDRRGDWVVESDCTLKLRPNSDVELDTNDQQINVGAQLRIKVDDRVHVCNVTQVARVGT